MKTIGLLGGMSWESTAIYYSIINETIKSELGGLHSGKILLYSVDFAEIEECQSKGDWVRSADILSEAAIKLEKSGADFLGICTNTMHKIAPIVQKRISIPILHIADTMADLLIESGVESVGLLGTKYTMTEDFYTQRLMDRGLRVIIPEDNLIEEINAIIFNELCLGIISAESRSRMLEIIESVERKKVQAIILGCTEIGLLIKPDHVSLPIFDTAEIHARSLAMMSIK